MLPGRGRGRARAPPVQKETRTFQQASKSIEENLKKHLEKQENEGIFSDSDSDGDGGEVEGLVARLLDTYGGNVTDDLKCVLRDAIQSSACLICISSVKKTDSIWSCGTCFVSFHLVCIQRWAKDSIFQQKQQLEDDPDRVVKESKICWSCPKCRNEYKPLEIPQRYECYCGKEVDPQFDPWQTPHSCGNRCNRQLAGCSHRCMLLCHPGPCPPCPQTVNISCHCGQGKISVRRCSDSLWSCGKQCGKELGCKSHPCQEICHQGPCPPCPRTSIQSCQCKKTKEPRPCSSPVFKCGHICGKLHACGHHACDSVCHPGPCPPCPLSLERYCPCGKSSFQLSCTEATPTCGDTCGKLLACGSHNCAERCHRGKCPSCLQMRVKQCKCGAKKREVQCAKIFSCETKCKKLRDCQRHPCNKKCCSGPCPPCEQMCGKTLGCKSHKCVSRCHRGACFPCQKTVEMKCICGATKQVVPCGREKIIKPPKCKKPCTVETNCHHEKRQPHNCHPPPCPPCKQVCDQELPCGHACPQPCHDNVIVKVQPENGRPAGPWEARAPQTKVFKQPCPPCQFPVPVTCLGGHETASYPCHNSKPSSCGRKCGRYLPCGNHQCERDCHRVRHAEADNLAGVNCKKCERECQLERPPGCTHKCSLPCHPRPCPPCNAVVKIKCHCGLNNLIRKCGEYIAASEEEKDKLRCCQDICPKMMKCGHRCVLVCHQGPCSPSDQCKKKVKIYCACKRRKEEFKCNQTFEKEVVIQCDEECKRANLKTSGEQLKILDEREREEELRNKREAELFERQMEGGKKRRRNRRKESVGETASFLQRNRFYLIIGVAAALLSVIFFAFVPHEI